MISASPPRTSAAAVRTAAPPAPRLHGVDVLFIIALNAVIIVGMWIRHGGITLLGTLDSNLLGAGQLTALLGTYAALVQIVLMSRSPWLEHHIGMDRLAHWHRWLGFSCVWLILAHVVLSTFGYALGDGRTFFGEFWTLLTQYPWMVMATIATVLFIMLAVSSVRAARRRLRYETWQFLHLYAYLGVALAFGHELAIGFDFSTDPLAVDYWIALYVAVAALVVAFRIGNPLRLWLRHGLYVESIVPENDTTVSLYIGGRHLERLGARSGQFFKWRFLTRNGWWKAHPFSLSAAPTNKFLRITIKRVGDGTDEIQRTIVPGTRVVAEGPFGVFTSARRRHVKTLLVAGGIGITPLRALIEDLPGGKGSMVLVYRARREQDIIFRAELDQMVSSRRGRVHYITGDDADGTAADPLAAARLRALVPDIADRDIYVCGPPPMMETTERSLHELGLDRSQIHMERFALL